MCEHFPDPRFLLRQRERGQGVRVLGQSRRAEGAGGDRGTRLDYQSPISYHPSLPGTLTPAPLSPRGRAKGEGVRTSLYRHFVGSTGPLASRGDRGSSRSTRRARAPPGFSRGRKRPSASASSTSTHVPIFSLRQKVQHGSRSSDRGALRVEERHRRGGARPCGQRPYVQLAIGKERDAHPELTPRVCDVAPRHGSSGDVVSATRSKSSR